MKARLVLNLVYIYVGLGISEPSASASQIVRFTMCTTTPSKVPSLEDLFLESLSKSKVMQTASHSSVLVFIPKHLGVDDTAVWKEKPWGQVHAPGGGSFTCVSWCSPRGIALLWTQAAPCWLQSLCLVCRFQVSSSSVLD